MRRLLTSGIKAIVAIAALSTAAHWAMRVQRAPTAMPAPVAAAKDPVSTGSIPMRSTESPASERLADVTRGLDQKHLGELFSGAAGDKPKVEKAAARH
ncbi:hypothetical protein MBUL_00111 [Methylobacterium bullatum]|uniref:Uncharacterized protein n=1 Tax=Methylobacterium bullatum TaxID=570505 RepID=A0A679IHN0_9HYPH|nr:hypothetical protein MBUL_00111 [Methylobacterium bullatum]